MKKFKGKGCLLAVSILALQGCANIGTLPEQITGSYISPVKYEKYTCSQLVAENTSLSRRLKALEVAQTSRVGSNKIQAFWLGYGNGDGVEASELAYVKGSLEAVYHTMDNKGCEE